MYFNMSAIRIIDDHLELTNIGSNTHAQIDTHIAAADNYIKRDGSLSAALLRLSSTSPCLTIHNTDHEDTDYGREGEIVFKGEQSGGEETTLGKIQVAHDGTSDDQKGIMSFKVNDGTDGDVPTTAMTILANGNVGIGTAAPGMGLQIGTDTGSHSLTASKDVMIDGKLEIDGYIYADGGRMYFSADGGGKSEFNFLKSDGSTPIMYIATNQNWEQVVFSIKDVGGRQIVIGKDSNRDYDHVTQANPTLYIHSNLDPDTNNTRWLSLTHTGTEANANYGLIETGAGDLVLNPNGNIGIGTTDPSAKLDINSDIIRLRTAKTPASAGAAGNTGDWAWDATHFYICVATNTWERTTHATW